MLFEIRLTIVRYGRRVQPVAPCGRAGLPPKVSHLRTKLSQKAKQQPKFPLRASSMLSGVEDATWKPLSLRVLMNEMPSVSRMREIRTSGLRRGEGLTKQSLLYSTGEVVGGLSIPQRLPSARTCRLARHSRARKTILAFAITKAAY